MSDFHGVTVEQPPCDETSGVLKFQIFFRIIFLCSAVSFRFTFPFHLLFRPRAIE